MDYVIELNFFNYLRDKDFINLIRTCKNFYILYNTEYVYKYYLYKLSNK